MPRLYGSRIMLREYQESDLDKIVTWVGNPETVQYLSDIFLYPQSAKQSRKFLDHAMSGDWTGFVIAHRTTAEYIGQIDFVSLDLKNGCGELGMVIGEGRSRGQGFGREALELLLRFGFDEVRLNRIQLSVWAGNAAARRAYEAVGFVQEGIRRQRWYRRGSYHDEVCYAMLQDEWRGRAAAGSDGLEKKE